MQECKPQKNVNQLISEGMESWSSLRLEQVRYASKSYHDEAEINFNIIEVKTCMA